MSQREERPASYANVRRKCIWEGGPEVFRGARVGRCAPCSRRRALGQFRGQLLDTEWVRRTEQVHPVNSMLHVNSQARSRSLPALALALLVAAQPSGAQLSIQQLTSLLAGQWRSAQRGGRALGAAQLLAGSQLIVIPKLEITSPTVPRDDRNDSVTSPSPSPPSPPPSRPADASPVRPPAPPADPTVPLRNPTVIMSYDRREDRAEADGRRGRAREEAALPVTSGFHDAALLMLQKMGMEGRPCLLRAVCELSARPLSSNGLLGDLVNAVVEIPSTSDKVLEEELKVSRQLGLRGAPCTEVFDNCDNLVINQLAK
ncbi:hypothetical protein FJT64_027775 [Amphibalanus amphitrite]|uniref:Uncharacterized protein n=1 Tax=Amphibalanus amphitrite TaxID=1232801 RepID=A0A6A4W2I2_AMPAM|nr:hypothetical protein FJT64_027775 [Amphibalanus amphitrite]